MAGSAAGHAGAGTALSTPQPVGATGWDGYRAADFSGLSSVGGGCRSIFWPSRRAQHDFLAALQALAQLDRRSEIAADLDAAPRHRAVVARHRHLGPTLVEDEALGRDHDIRFGARHLEAHVDVEAGAQGAVLVRHVDLGGESARRSEKRHGTAFDLAGEGPVGHLRHLDRGIDARFDPHRDVLWHVDGDAQDVVTVHRQEGRAGAVGVDEVAHIDTALGDHPVEGGDDVLEPRQRPQALDGGGLRLDVGLGHLHAGLRRGEGRGLAENAGLGIVCVLLRGPALSGERRGAVVGDVGEVHVGLGLIDHGFRLEESGLQLPRLRLGLGQLLVEVGGGDPHQDVALADAAADVDPALGDVARGAGVEGRLGEGIGLARQGDLDRPVRTLGGRRAQLRNEAVHLALGLGRGGAPLHLAVAAPGQEAEGRDGDQQERRLAGRRRDVGRITLGMCHGRPIPCRSVCPVTTPTSPSRFTRNPPTA
jgi:hypothetical protein